MAVDPITVEVIHNYYLSAAREMERNLMRTAYTTIVYEIRDFGLGIYDRNFRMMAESPGLAVFTCGNDYGLQKSSNSSASRTSNRAISSSPLIPTGPPPIRWMCWRSLPSSIRTC